MELAAVQPEGAHRRPEKRVFYSEKMRSDAFAAAGFAIAGLAIFAFATLVAARAGRNTPLLAIGFPALILFGAIALVLLHRFRDRSPLLRLSAEGIKSPQLKSSVSWADIDEVELDASGRLVLRLGKTANIASPVRIKLHRLRPRRRLEVTEEVLERVEAANAQAGRPESRTTRDIRANAQFDERLAALTPKTWALHFIVGANVLVWLANVASGLPILNPPAPALLHWGGDSASAVLLQQEYWRLLTGTFLHAGAMHLAFNMLGLWVPGRELARHVGNAQFLFVYLASALCGSAASLHYSSQLAVGVGASGAVFGVLGALLASSWKYRHHLPALKRKALWSGPALFTIYALMSGLGSSHVDNAAHIGGLACGAILGLLLTTRFDSAGVQVAPMQLVLGLVVSALAIVVGVMTMPVPLAWHHELVQAQGVLEKVLPQFAQLGKGISRFNGRAADDPEARSYLLGTVIPQCKSTIAQLGTLRLPGNDPLAQVGAAVSRLCVLTIERVEITTAPMAPTDARQAGVRVAGIDAEMKALAAKLSALRSVVEHGARPQR
jgi:rhomboid protease GluP